MKKFVRYFEQPGYRRSRLEFGLMDPRFAKDVIALIPDSWHKSEIMKDSKTGRLFIFLKHHHGLFWELVDIVNNMKLKDEISLESRNFKDSKDRIFYKTLN